MEITVNAHAKINLLLDITGRRPDGYHTITGVMQAVSLSDTVTVGIEHPMRNSPSNDGSITLTCSDSSLPTDGKNLAWRAALAFKEATGCGWEHLRVAIDKHIPAAAGLAGGSTDAAAVLTALNRLYGSPLSPDERGRVGLGLGADVPFCLHGGACVTEGVGETLTPLPSLPPCRILLACGGEGVSTPAAYRALDDTYGNFAPGAYAPHTAELSHLIAALRGGDLAGVCAHTFNIFESVVLPTHPVARAIRDTLLDAGAMTAMMSGSGPSVFGIFHPADETGLRRAYAALEARGVNPVVCEASTPNG